MCVLLSPSGDCYLADYSGDLVLANFANTRLPILSYHYPQYADLRMCEYSDIIQSNSDTIQSSVLVDCYTVGTISVDLQMVTYYEPLTKVYLLCVDLQ